MGYFTDRDGSKPKGLEQMTAANYRANATHIFVWKFVSEFFNFLSKNPVFSGILSVSIRGGSASYG